MINEQNQNQEINNYSSQAKVTPKKSINIFANK